MEQLNSDAPLSHMLSHIRLLASINNDPVTVALSDMLIHGLLKVPYQKPPFTNTDYKSAGIEYIKLCSTEDFSDKTVNGVIAGLKKGTHRDSVPKQNEVIVLSVYEMETSEPPPSPVLGTESEMFDILLRQTFYYREIKACLIRLRAYMYDYVSRIWIEATREKDRIELLGTDYRFITDKLNALETPIGGVLLAAIDNLASDNPDKWSLSALACRNVVIQLGTTLWKVPGETYQMQRGENLLVSNDKEKNKLLAYVDIHRIQGNPTNQDLLDQADKLIHSIYTKGSKGKKPIRHSEVQALIIDTFQLVSLLLQVTDFTPAYSLS